MKIVFFKGTVRTQVGNSSRAAWASTPFGYMVWDSENERAHLKDTMDILTQEVVTELNLSGVDRAGVDTLVANILAGGYLERTGVKGKGEAVLFLLVNEAIHSLNEIARKEGL